MDTRFIRNILVALVGLGLIILVIVLLVKGFSGGNKSAAIPETNLSSYASTSAQAQLYIDGPINLDQDHRTVHIIVDQTHTQIDVIQGYQGNVIATQSFPNDQAGYAVFLQALKNLNFARGNTSADKADERGYCATGNRYIYQFTNNGENLFRFWSTSCGSGGTFGGSSREVRQLFERQIPSAVFNKLTNAIPLG